MVKQRIIFGLIMGSLAIFLCWLDNVLVFRAAGWEIRGIIWSLIVEVLLIVSVKEFIALARDKGARVFPFAAYTGASLLALGYFLRQFWVFFPFPCSLEEMHLVISIVAVLSTMSLSFLTQGRNHGNEGTILNCGATILTVMYLGFLTSFFLAIRLNHGIFALILFISVVKLCDVGAYTFGKLFGKHKFAPIISPKKTWEGLAGGALFSAIAGASMSAGFHIMDWKLGAVFGIVFAFIGQYGDLMESMLKRDAGIKDSGHKLPGFGGILDIVDSLVFSAPFAYLFLNMFAR
ncbi:MAG: phosphatidate cytidylyltransferase [Phycisphaerae bacterium]